MDRHTINNFGSHSLPSPTTCEDGFREGGTLVPGSPEYYRGCKRPCNEGSGTIKHIKPNNDALTNCDDSVRKWNVARVLFDERMVKQTQEYKISPGHLCGSDNHGETTSFSQGLTNREISNLSTDGGFVSTERRQLITDSQAVQVLSTFQPPLITDNKFTKIVSSHSRPSPPGQTPYYPTSWASDKGWEVNDDSTAETVFLPDHTEDDAELDKCWIGYEDELFQIEIDKKKRTTHTDGFLFDSGTKNQMVMKMGQRFKDDFQFRRAVEVQAIRDGIKLCRMDNSSTCVSCECSDLNCDWKITAVKDHGRNEFVISDLTPTHTCNKRLFKLQWGTTWIAAKFLHIWNQNVPQHLDVLANEIAAAYGMKCPFWKLNAVDSVATMWLRIGHTRAYAQLLQFKHEMEIVNDRNIVLIETKTDHQFSNQIFDRMFVFLYDTAYAFKTRCRMLLTVDGWEIDGPYNSVMLVAVCRDGNDAVLPIAFCEVEEENLDSWAFFLKNISYGLRLDRGEGLCILGDGDNGIDEVVEEFLPYAVYRQCCFSLYNRLLEQFPDVQIHSAFWGACRSSDKNSFLNQMAIIERVNVDCHNWLKHTDCHKWALFSMPEWVKSTEVTKSASEQLRIWLAKYLDLNVSQRYTTITRKIAEVFEKRYLAGWEWVYDKLTPAARQHIIQNIFEGEGWIVDVPSANAVSTVSRHGLVYQVNKELMTCSCRLWQLSGIPCQHACRCIDRWGGKMDTYTHKLWSVDEYRSMYGPGMIMLPQIMHWNWQIDDNLLPPMKKSSNFTGAAQSIYPTKSPRLDSDILSDLNGSSTTGPLNFGFPGRR